MTKTNDLPIFDGHNDALQSIYLPKNGKARSFFDRNDKGHIDLPRMREGGYGGGFFAIFVPSNASGDGFPGADPKSGKKGYNLPLPPAVDFAHAQRITLKGMAGLFRLEAQSNGQIKVVRTAGELVESLRRKVIAVVLHFEGAEAIDPALDSLEVFFQAGLRSLGISWSRPNVFAHGVPFRFPHSPDTGPGLSDAGRNLVKTCNRLGIMIDLAHINEKGFWDAAGITDAPLVVTHAGVHALCPSTRNLTDKQLDAIGESRGVVGINFHVGFLRQDGLLEPDTPLEVIVSHIEYIAHRIGIDHVALGSDFDGAIMPQQLGDVAGMPKLIKILREHGLDNDSLHKIAHANWERVLRETWK
ncbi:MAG: dipeptidase [Desulfobacterales bacterium]|nr:MAG: dipeptidase [Desulfobacterales bacterium]